MINRNPLLECLGRYSKQNLTLMLFDNQHDLAESIWRLAERFIHREMVADDGKCREFIEMTKGSLYDGILFRHVENLSPGNQLLMMRSLIGMSREQRGKIIFTTDNFERVETGLLMQVCKIKFRVEVRQENAEDDRRFMDYETNRKDVGRYF